MQIGIFFFEYKMKNKIAIQGIKGSFHHQVALNYFDETIVVDEFCL